MQKNKVFRGDSSTYVLILGGGAFCRRPTLHCPPGFLSVMVQFQVIKIGPQNGYPQAPRRTMLVTMLEAAA